MMNPFLWLSWGHELRAAASVLEKTVPLLRRAASISGVRVLKISSHSHSWPQKQMHWSTEGGVERSLEIFLENDSAGYCVCGYAMVRTGGKICIQKLMSGIDVEGLRALGPNDFGALIDTINSWGEKDMIPRTIRSIDE